MVKTIDILDLIKKEAVAMAAAKAKYDTAFDGFSRMVPPLAPEYFWPIVDKYRDVVLSTMIRSQENISEFAADEFMHWSYTNAESPFDRSSFSLSEAIHFALSWSHYSDSLLVKNRLLFGSSEDAYGDLMDALPLLGQEMYDKVLNGYLTSLNDFNQAVELACVNSVSPDKYQFQFDEDPAGRRLALVSRLRKIIVQGENYFAMRLVDAAKKWLVSTSDIQMRNSVGESGHPPT